MQQLYVKFFSLPYSKVEIEENFDIGIIFISIKIKDTIPHIEGRVLGDIVVNQDSDGVEYLSALDSEFDWKNKVLMMGFDSSFVRPKRMEFHLVK